MAGDNFKRVTSGDPLAFSAPWYNGTLDAIRAAKSGQRPGTKAKFHAGPARNTDTITVVNESDTDCSQFYVLGIDDVRYKPPTKLNSFRERPVLNGVEPTDAHKGKFVILLQPARAEVDDEENSIPPGVAIAAVDGVCPVQVNVVDAAHKWADVKDGDVTQLESGPTGSARILWKESGTGTKWALVRLGDRAQPAGMFAVQVEKTGGSDGTSNTAASWTYTVKDLGGETLGTGIGVTRPRPNGKMTFQAGSTGYGVAFYAADGTLKLWDAGEIETSEVACPEPEE